MTGPGRVFLVGAGPGDPELLTLKAHRRIAEAEAVVYDRLVSPQILGLLPGEAEHYPVGKAPQNHPVPQDQINALLIELAVRGLRVVRLKGGDPFVFGRGGEELMALQRAGIPCEVVPGITSAQGAAAASALPLTHRGIATGLRFVTGHCRSDLPLDVDWAGLADPRTTLVVYMGAANIGLISANLIAYGMPGDMPVLAISNATQPTERRLRATLRTLALGIRNARLANPVLFVIGHVVALSDTLPAPVLSEIVADLPREALHA